MLKFPQGSVDEQTHFWSRDGQCLEEAESQAGVVGICGPAQVPAALTWVEEAGWDPSGAYTQG